MSPGLQMAVETAYRIFATYRVGRDLVVCHCNVCMDDATEHLLVSTPLRQITSSLLAEYTNSAHGYDAGRIADELRYFLPRYFELIAGDDPPHALGPDFVLCRLGSANYRETWPRREADAIDTFFDALLLDRLAQTGIARGKRVAWVPERSLESELSLMANGGCDLERILDVWFQAPDPGSAIHMASLRLEIEGTGDARRIRYCMMNLRDSEVRIAQWLQSAEVTTHLEHALFATTDTRLQRLFSDALG